MVWTTKKNMSRMLFRCLFPGPSTQTQTDPMFTNRNRLSITWLKTVSKRSQRLGRSQACTCMMGTLTVPLPLPYYFTSSSSSSESALAVACLTRGYKLHCLLFGLVQGCVWAWLLEILGPIAVPALCSLGAQSAGIHNGLSPHEFVGQRLFSGNNSLSNQTPTLTLQNNSSTPPLGIVSQWLLDLLFIVFHHH